jgi:hypothetical protein
MRIVRQQTKLLYLLNPAAKRKLQAARTGQGRGGRLVVLEGGCGLGRNGCGGDTADDNGKSKNTDGEFHGLVTPCGFGLTEKMVFYTPKQWGELRLSYSFSYSYITCYQLNYWSNTCRPQFVRSIPLRLSIQPYPEPSPHAKIKHDVVA